ncbi:MAG: PorT family protein [Flavobacteriales bacterium]|nr:PorT family protein [Flavobacteriales bacterium]
MRKWKVAVLALAIAGATANTSKAQLAVGVKGGATLSSMSGKAAAGSEKDMLFGYQFGALVNYGFSKTFSLQPEVLFIQKGGKTSSSSTSDYTQVTANYLEIPILAKAQFGGEKFKGYAVLGPYASYWVGGHTKSNVLGTESKESIDFDNNIDDDGYKQHRFDLGLNGGLGMQYAVGRGNVFLDARYGFGLFDTNKYKTEPSGYKTQANRSIQLSLGYTFRLSKEG